jgi:hypothetical protein
MGQKPDLSVDQGKSGNKTNLPSAEPPSDDRVEAPSDDRVEAPLDYMAEAPSGDAAEAPASDAAEAPASDAAEAPASDAAEAPSGETVEASSGETAEASSGETAEASSGETVEASSGETAEASSGETAEASSGETAEASSDDAAEASSNVAGEASSGETVEASSDATVVNETIVVKAGETFDGGNQTYTAGSALGDGSQDEGQEPIFRLEEGATLKNVVIGDNGADGVHVYGDATIDNVHWTNVGEDALSIKDSGEDGIADVLVTNSSARDAEDKVFQVNADAKLTIDNFKVENFGMFVRTNGGQQGDFEINLNNITAKNAEEESLVRSDAEGIVVNWSNIETENTTEAWQLWDLPDSATVNQIG